MAVGVERRSFLGLLGCVGDVAFVLQQLALLQGVFCDNLFDPINPKLRKTVMPMRISGKVFTSVAL